MDWFGLAVVSLPGLAALAALLFTWMQVGQASKELRISEQGQITNRFNAAVTNLGSDSVDVRLGESTVWNASCRTPSATTPRSSRS